MSALYAVHTTIESPIDESLRRYPRLSVARDCVLSDHVLYAGLNLRGLEAISAHVLRLLPT